MATVEEISRVRRRIGDSVKGAVQRIVGDGVSTELKLEFKNVFDVKVTIDSIVLDPSNYTVHQTPGIILFGTAIGDGSTVDVVYSYAAYTDDMLAGLIANYGVEGAIVEALQELLVDSARLYDYQQGQTTDKRSQVFDHLEKLLANAKADFVATSSNGVRMGRRTPDSQVKRQPAIDLSRDDTWSDNNV